MWHTQDYPLQLQKSVQVKVIKNMVEETVEDEFGFLSKIVRKLVKSKRKLQLNYKKAPRRRMKSPQPH